MGQKLKDNLINLIAKIGEKITIRRSDFLTIKRVQLFFTYIQQLKKILVK